MELTTDRLRTCPFSLAEFKLLLEGQARLDALWGLEPGGSLNDETREAMTGLYALAEACPREHLFLTNWQIIVPALNRAIGSACFRGGLNERGEVEVGYGLHPPYRGRGFMTEAVRALCVWAFEQPGIRAVVAETDKDNPASHRVLERCGMERTEERGTICHWRLLRGK